MRLTFACRLFGRVDQVPKTCYVATLFYHFSFFPIWPAETWLVIAGSETDFIYYNSWRGFQISRSWKSILYAWVRAPLLLCGFGGMLFAWLQYLDKPRGNESPFAISDLIEWFTVSVLLVVAFALSYWFSRANGRRAQELKHLLEEGERAAEGIPSSAGSTTFGQTCISAIPPVVGPSTRQSNDSWEDFCRRSEALQRELTELSQVPPLKFRENGAKSERADKDAELGIPIGAVPLASHGGITQYLFCGLLVSSGLVAVPLGVFALLLPPEVTRSVIHLNPREPNAHVFLAAVLLCGGAVSLALGIALTMLLRRTSSKARLVVCENGLLYEHGRRTDLIPWHEVETLLVSNATRKPLYTLTLPYRKPIVISSGHGPDTMDLMSYVEFRLTHANFLSYLEEICQGNRKRLGVIQFDRRGLAAPEFFVPWREISRVFADEITVFIDWSGSKTCIEIPRDQVSMPRLALSLAQVLVTEHTRLPVLDAGHFRR